MYIHVCICIYMDVYQVAPFLSPAASLLVFSHSFVFGMFPPFSFFPLRVGCRPARRALRSATAALESAVAPV